MHIAIHLLVVAHLVFILAQSYFSTTAYKKLMKNKQFAHNFTANILGFIMANTYYCRT